MAAEQKRLASEAAAPAEASPKKRIMKARGPGNAMSSGVVGEAQLCRSGNHIHIAFFRLSKDASLILPNASEDVEAFLLAFSTEDGGGIARNFASSWSSFLSKEALTAESLMEQYNVVAKLGSPPEWVKSIFVAGDYENGWALLENYILYKMEDPVIRSLPCSTTIHNHTEIDLRSWLAESSMKEVVVTEEKHPQLHWRLASFPEQRRPVLHVKEPSRGQLQLVLGGHTWPFARKLSWQGMYVELGYVSSRARHFLST